MLPFVVATCALLVLGLAATAPVRADSISGFLGMNTLTLVGPAVVGWNTNVTTIAVTYMNNGPITMGGRVFFDIQNLSGYTVCVANSTALAVDPGGYLTAIVALTLPTGLYTATFFVVSSGGVVLSPTNSTIFLA